MFRTEKRPIIDDRNQRMYRVTPRHHRRRPRQRFSSGNDQDVRSSFQAFTYRRQRCGKDMRSVSIFRRLFQQLVHLNYRQVFAAPHTGYSVLSARIAGIDFKIRTIDLDGKKIKLQIWDTAGQERFRTITTAYYRGAMGIMLVYDITNEKSFDNIKNWIRNIEEHASQDVERMIIGNKCDAEDKRQVSRERGQQLAIEYGTKFMETSAKANLNVEEAFFSLARDIKSKMERGQAQAVSQSGRVTVGGQSQQKKGLFSGWSCTIL
ncbi:hypothetical protein Q1695_010367 [Nippostrongylus brasiliensis]|nr:hypothetical protein Q1695_010367 [Nippostrongylus brasiliensis]